ncbi:hypothetical protein T07_10640 [Trichinella nelsoni]|uniref:Uncharacterized protein n=1 Tax=Trichinella nelsoni TaxID=6336 RepID=A0A0V0RGS0_9BILA|nr:hypothetical protein T07_10640 [Trichinella nelsoni]
MYYLKLARNRKNLPNDCNESEKVSSIDALSSDIRKGVICQKIHFIWIDKLIFINFQRQIKKKNFKNRTDSSFDICHAHLKACLDKHKKN